MPVAFTAEQKLAIETRGCDMLVSAAAGSGKTAVLTERIIRLVTEDADGTGPLDIDKLLVVTFTEAAAAEMRERIAAKIDERLKQDPGNAHLQRQAALLPSARVSTIHAFCRRLVKEHFARVDLDPAFKVGDETELSLLQAQVMDELFEEEYDRPDPACFIDLVDAFGGRTRDDRLDALVRVVNNFIESSPYPEETARAYVDVFTRGAENLDNTVWADIVRDELSAGLAGALDAVERALAVCRLPEGPALYQSALEGDARMLGILSAALDKPFAEMCEMFGQVQWDRLYTYRGSAKEAISPSLQARVKSMREKGIKERVSKLAKNCFFAPPGKMQSDIQALQGRVASLVELALRYRQKYADEKRARNLLDFGDLEHYAVQILSEPLVFPFREVLIDEYQDSNAVQELILSAVAGSAPRFMVGDVKQSIYRFRRADPGLFIDKYNRYERLPITPEPSSGCAPTAPVRVDLTRNFRSRPQVLDTVNFFFSQLMSPEMGDVRYDAQAALYPGADYPEPPADFTYETLIELADCTDYTDSSEYAEETDDAEDAPEDNKDIDKDIDKIEWEARLIARRVRALAGRKMIWDREKQAYRPCRLGDMVILTRSVSSSSAKLTETLKSLEIDAVADIGASFFDTPEVGTALSFLRVVDNPRQDIDLVTVLYSPVYAFTPDELLVIRRQDNESLLYDCLIACASATDDPGTGEKARRFLADLEKWRAQAAYLSVSRLIGVIYDDTRYPAYVGALPGGRIRQANLRLLLERAIQYEETGLKSVFHFVRFIENLKASGDAGRVNAAQINAEAEDKIRIMSIHKSKGLEFPIVFVSLLGKELNPEDERRNIVLHPEHGLGPTYVDLAAHTRANTLARLGLSKLARRDRLSEELRVLYVAMTRAKELLVLTGCVSKWEAKREKWAAAAHFSETLLPAYYRRECVTYLDWLMPCLARHRDGYILRGDENDGAGEGACGEVFTHPASFSMQVLTKEALSGPDTDEVVTAVETTLRPPVEAPAPPVVLTAADYPYENVRSLPSKVSISEIKRLYALETSPDSTPFYETVPVFEKPGWIGEPRVGATGPAFIREAKGMTAMRSGTVLHTVAEHIDLHAHRTRDAIEELIASLTARNLLTPAEAASADRLKIERFANSTIADRMRAASALYREVPFVMGLTPREVYPDYDISSADETILVHGIIDCYFEEGEKLVLVDYKSDTITGDPAQWAERYRIQMNIYRKAVSRATGRDISETLLYAFALGDTVVIN